MALTMVHLAVADLWAREHPEYAESQLQNDLKTYFSYLELSMPTVNKLCESVLYRYSGNLNGTDVIVLSGIDYAVPLLSGTLARVLAVMFTLLCFFCSRKGAGGVPALLLCVSVLLLIWLADRFELIWFHLPALIAALMLLMMDRHPELSPARILPWLAGLSLLCVLLTPPSGIVAPGLKEKADHLRQQILDRLFYTEPRDVFSLMNEGYYPQGN